MAIFNIPTKQLRTVTSPSVKDAVTYTALINFKDLPADISLDVNPRKPKMNTNVAHRLINAVTGPDMDFDLKNRGIVIIAKNVKYDTTNRTLHLDLGSDNTKYGILDGGHTYTAIIENRDALDDDINKFVKLEILVGESLDASGLADARNTSVQVSDIALFELDDKFDIIKSELDRSSFGADIAYKDNDNKRVPIAEIIRLLFAYNINRFSDDTNVPTTAYSSKAAVFKDYKNNYDQPNNIYKASAKHILKLVELYETIEKETSVKYQEYKKQQNSNGAFGKVRGIEGKGSFNTEFTNQHTDYKVASGFILPMFGAFRALVNPTENGEWEWLFDPIDVWNKVGTKLVQNIFDTETNPQMAGKSKTLWQSSYRIVDGIKKDMLLEKFMTQMK